MVTRKDYTFSCIFYNRWKVMVTREGLQEVLDIGNVNIGGESGINPTCMVGSMFHRGDKAVTDHKRGTFVKDKVLDVLGIMEKASRETCIPFIVDVVGNSPENLVKYCTFIAEHTENKHQPFLMDGLNDTVRIPAVKALAQQGLGDRLIYNSIEPKISDDSLETLADCKVKHAVLLAFDSRFLLPEQKFKLLRGWGDRKGKMEGLIPKAKRCGIRNLLVDAAVLDMPSIGIAARIIQDVKEFLGYPAGCAPSNAIFKCQKFMELGRDARKSSLVTACGFLASQGADFILFGPASYASEAFMAVAQVDAFIAYAKRRIERLKFDAGTHPLSRVF
ncbi:tetrahydromethanopterin S-methyltransferase subunit H [Candidatus Bathyarchaeota archaeon]|nr:tetrahydromethanopterin S-methyltransferase subunit H [Candidatus Bathyarchaeota archaeon]